MLKRITITFAVTLQLIIAATPAIATDSTFHPPVACAGAGVVGGGVCVEPV